MKPLKYVLPEASDKVLYVFYDFETTQNAKYSDKTTLHVPDLDCVQQFCCSAKMRETVESAGDVVRGSTRSGTIR